MLVVGVYVYQVVHGCQHPETMQIRLLGGITNEGALVISRADLREICERSRRKLCAACVTYKAET